MAAQTQGFAVGDIVTSRYQTAGAHWRVEEVLEGATLRLRSTTSNRSRVAESFDLKLVPQDAVGKAGD